MSGPRPIIVGIVLVRNEDIHVRDSVRNIASFCDKILLCDHGSTDGTRKILGELAEKIPHASVHLLRHPRESHDLLQAFVGTNAWIFGVDGDEIYDPALLEVFRPRFLDGEFSRVWRMKGNVLHCTAIDPEIRTATGYMAPPSRSITKLYNFSAIEAWDGDTFERLHGGKIRFKTGFCDGDKRNFQERLGWNETPLRCLHVCFLRRSSSEPLAAAGEARKNIVEIYRSGRLASLLRPLARFLRLNGASRWKRDYYRQGPLATVDIHPFFPQ